jgi:SAM-dependent methyltransferase
MSRVAQVIGIDRSAPMLARAIRRGGHVAPAPRVVRGDIRALPFARAHFAAVIAPYGMLQSLLSDRDLHRTLAEAARVLRAGGLFGIDLVPDVPAWSESGPRRRLTGRSDNGARITLIESVRQDRRRGVTEFHEQFLTRRGAVEERREFSLRFRTLPIETIVSRVERAGFAIDAVLGDYRGRPWDARAETWIILARRTI